MGLKTYRTESFSSSVHGENLLHLRKGSTCIDDTWVHFRDQIIDINSLIEKFVSDKKVFHKLGDLKYILVALNKSGSVTLFESIEDQATEDVEIKVFEDLSNVIPLVLVKLTHDGISGLTGIVGLVNLTEKDLEVYKGYGNFTIKGDPGIPGTQGPTGYQGHTGVQGVQGIPGLVGVRGRPGLMGVTGVSTLGITGPRGNPGGC